MEALLLLRPDCGISTDVGDVDYLCWQSGDYLRYLDLQMVLLVVRFS